MFLVSSHVINCPFCTLFDLGKFYDIVSIVFNEDFVDISLSVTINERCCVCKAHSVLADETKRVTTITISNICQSQRCLDIVAEQHILHFAQGFFLFPKTFLVGFWQVPPFLGSTSGNTVENKSRTSRFDKLWGADGASNASRSCNSQFLCLRPYGS